MNSQKKKKSRIYIAVAGCFLLLVIVVSVVASCVGSRPYDLDQNTTQYGITVSYPSNWDFIDMENMLVLADDEGIFGSSMSDSTRVMVTEITQHVLIVVYCFEDGIDLPVLLETGKKAFADFADIQDAKTWIVEELE